jgi:predicted molibdopterin-dependent oxidoreductase YjgC
MNNMLPLWSRLPAWLQRRDGEMTRELLLRPGDHGLGMTPDSMQADATTTAVCGYCSTGCGLRLHIKDQVALGLTPETNYPVNLGMACPKGWEALRVLESDDRATRPLMRLPDGEMKAVSWDEALTTFTRRFKAIQQQHGNDSVAFLSTGQIPSEEMALLGAVAKFGMGIVHGDGNTRQCIRNRSDSMRHRLPTMTSNNRIAWFLSARIFASVIPSCGNACCEIGSRQKSLFWIHDEPKRQWQQRSIWRCVPRLTS